MYSMAPLQQLIIIAIGGIYAKNIKAFDLRSLEMKMISILEQNTI